MNDPNKSRSTSFDIAGAGGARTTAAELRRRLMPPVIPESEQWRYDSGRLTDMATIQGAIGDAEQGRMAQITDLSTKTIDVDPNLASLLGRRLGAIEALLPTLTPAEGEGVEKDKAKKIADTILRELGMLPAPTFDTCGSTPGAGISPIISSMSWAIWDGRSALENVWADVKDPSRGVSTAVDQVVWVHPRRLSFGPRRELRLQEAWWQVGNFADVGLDITKTRFKFLTWTPQYFREYPEREGYAPRCLYWSFTKRFAARERLILAELFGKPWKIIDLDPESRLTQEELDVLDEEVEKLGERDQARLPKGAKLTVPWPHPDSGTIHQGIIEEADSQLARLLLGQPFTSMSNSANKSQSDVGEGQQDLLAAKDARAIEVRLQAGLIAAIVTLNAQALGLENDLQVQAYAPKLCLKSKTEIDRNSEVDRLTKIVAGGIPVALGEVYEVSGYRRPDEEQVAAIINGVFTVFESMDECLEAMKGAHESATAMQDATLQTMIEPPGAAGAPPGSDSAPAEDKEMPPGLRAAVEAAIDARMLAFNPDQPRDKDGKWSAEGASDAADAKEDRRANLRVRVSSTAPLKKSDKVALLGHVSGYSLSANMFSSAAAPKGMEDAVTKTIESSPVLRATLERFPLNGLGLTSSEQEPWRADKALDPMGQFHRETGRVVLVARGPEIGPAIGGGPDGEITGTVAQSATHWSEAGFADRSAPPTRAWTNERDQAKLTGAVFAHEVGHALDFYSDRPSAELFQIREKSSNEWKDRREDAAARAAAAWNAKAPAPVGEPGSNEHFRSILENGRRKVEQMDKAREYFSLRNPRSQAISLYANASPQEDFAETFSAYVVYPTALREHDRAGYDFIERTLEKVGILVDKRKLAADDKSVLLSMGMQRCPACGEMAYDQDIDECSECGYTSDDDPDDDRYASAVQLEQQRGGKGTKEGGQFIAKGASGTPVDEKQPKPPKGAIEPDQQPHPVVASPENVTSEVKSWDHAGDQEKTLSAVRKDAKFAEVSGSVKESASAISRNARLAVGQYAKSLSGEDAVSLNAWAADTSSAFVEAYPDADAATVDKLMRESVDRVMYQHREAMGRALTDHGVRHIMGDVDNGNQLLDAMAASGLEVSARDRALMNFALAHHDYGYTAPSQRETFKNDDHVAIGAEIFKADIEPELAKVVGNDDAAWATYAIATHSDAKLDWENEPRVSALRVADNFSVFASQKLPNVLRDVPGAIDDLKEMKLSSDDAGFKSALASLSSNIEKSPVDEQTKVELRSSLKDFSKYTPEVFLGRLAGDLTGFEFGNIDGALGMTAHVKYTDDAEVLRDTFNIGQADMMKWATGLGVKAEDLSDASKLENGLRMTYKGKTVGMIKVEGAAAVAATEGLAEQLTKNPGGFTWNPIVGTPKDGVMVAYDPSEKRGFKIEPGKAGLKPKEIKAAAADLISKQLAFIQEDPEHRFFGGWANVGEDGKVEGIYVEAAERFDEKDEAKALASAKERNQLAAFRLSDFTELKTGGSGEGLDKVGSKA